MNYMLDLTLRNLTSIIFPSKVTVIIKVKTFPLNNTQLIPHFCFIWKCRTVNPGLSINNTTKHGKMLEKKNIWRQPCDWSRSWLHSQKIHGMHLSKRKWTANKLWSFSYWQRQHFHIGCNACHHIQQKDKQSWASLKKIDSDLYILIHNHFFFQIRRALNSNFFIILSSL